MNALFYVVAIVVVIGSMFRGAFVSDDVGVRALEAQGFTKIEVVDNAFVAVGVRGCDAKDAARITLTATNPQGRIVTLYVCAGWPFKGATIRNP